MDTLIKKFIANFSHPIALLIIIYECLLSWGGWVTVLLNSYAPTYVLRLNIEWIMSWPQLFYIPVPTRLSTNPRPLRSRSLRRLRMSVTRA